MIDFEALLAGVIGHAPPDGLAEAMAEILPRYEINTPLRIAHFIGQTAEETGGYRVCVENLNYSAEALMRVWPGRFPTAEIAAEYAHQPNKIAEHVYSGRLGNGPEGSNEASAYIGRGLIQITGRSNYQQAADDTGMPLVDNPGLLADWGIASVAASAAFWRRVGCNELADGDNIVAITRRVNGGLTNFAARKAYTTKAKALLDQLAHQAPIPDPVSAPEPDPVQVTPQQPAPVLSDPGGGADAPDFTPLWRDLLTMARDRIASFGGGGAVIGASALAWLHKLSAADAILLVGAGLFVLVLVLWLGSRKEHRQQAEKVAALNAQPPGPKSELTDAQVAAFKAFLSVLESRGQAA